MREFYLGRDIEEMQEVSTSAFELTANDRENFRHRKQRLFSSSLVKYCISSESFTAIEVTDYMTTWSHYSRPTLSKGPKNNFIYLPMMQLGFSNRAEVAR